MENNNYKKTIEAYQALGKRYIENAANINLHALEDFMKLLPKGGRVLDAGCFGGRDSKKFADAGFEVTGIDLADVFIEEARKYVPQAKFMKMDILEMNFEESYFDGVLAQAVLLHLERSDVPRALKNFWRVLKPAGKIYVGVKEGKGFEMAADKELAAGYKRYFTYFKKEEMETYMREAGFKIKFCEFAPDYVGRDKKWIIIWGEKSRD